MTRKLSCNPQPRPLVTNPRMAKPFLRLAVVAFSCVPLAFAGSDAPQWMHALVNAPVPAHDEKTDAVKLYSEINVSVQSADRIKKTVRVAYKILRPSGRGYGDVMVPFNAHEKISGLHLSLIHISEPTRPY